MMRYRQANEDEVVFSKGKGFSAFRMKGRSSDIEDPNLIKAQNSKCLESSCMGCKVLKSIDIIQAV